MPNTGNIIVTERDANPYSSTYNTTRTRTYQDWGRCVPEIGNYKVKTTSASYPNRTVECNGYTRLSRSEVMDRNCETAIVGNCIEIIDDETFTNCYHLANVALSSNITTIGDYAFSTCNNLTGINIPNSVTSFGMGVFFSCTSLPRINIPNGVTVISTQLFYNCISLTSITIPNSVTIIGENAFEQCYGLTSITIPSSVTEIKRYAFKNCSGLTSITCLATTPPTLNISQESTFEGTGNCPIYVPTASVNAYKTSWNTYASRIQAIPTP